MTSFKPDGWPCVIRRLVTSDVAGLSEFCETFSVQKARSAPGRQRKCGSEI